MEKDIRELEERTKEISARVEKTNAVLEKTSALVEKTSAQLEKRSEEIRALGERIRAIGEEVTILSPLKSIAISMQERSSAASQSGEGVGEIEDRLAGWIESIEPTADVITDVCMFKNGLMHDNEAFTTLYGVDWQAAKELIGTPLHFYRLLLAATTSDTKCF